MSENQNVAPEMDLVAELQKQNLYQRLGFRSNEATYEELYAAKERRLALLKRCRKQLSRQDRRKARELIRVAYATLNNPKERASYDKKLLGPQPTVELPLPVVSASHSSFSQFEQGAELYRTTSTIVCAGIDHKTGNEVIFQRLRPELIQNKTVRRQFQSDVELLANCNAINLVRILDFDLDSGTVVVEKMAGDLSTIVRRNGCKPDEVFNVLRDILSGLGWLHGHGIAHGNISFDKLLLDDQGGVKIAIMPGLTGLSSSLRPDENVRHIAPELLQTNFGDPGTAADIYALGFLVLELLCGDKFAKVVSDSLSAKTASEAWLQWHSSSTDHMNQLEDELPGLPVRFVDMLSQMTLKNQYDRIRDAKECREILTKHALAESIAASEPELLEMIEDDELDVIGESVDIYERYMDTRKITWTDVRQDPKLLLQHEGRNHLIYLSLGALSFIAFCVILLNGGSDEPPNNTENRCSVEFIVEPIGRVVSVDGRDLADESNRWSLGPGNCAVVCAAEDGWTFETSVFIPADKPRATIQIDVPVIEEVQPVVEPTDDVDVPNEIAITPADQARDIEITPSVEKDTPPRKPENKVDDINDSEEPQVVLVPSPIPSPPKPFDPYVDVRGKAFYPNRRPFKLVGIPYAKSAAAKLLLNTGFNDILAKPYERKADLFNIGQQPVDPRASYSLALYAARRSELDVATQLCSRSLRDARHFEVPFVLPLRLLVQIHMRKSAPAPAINQCRSELHHALSHSRNDHFKDASFEIAWLLGHVIGFVEYAGSPSTKGNVNTAQTIAWLKRCAGHEFGAAVWEKYRIGRRNVYDQRKFLTKRKNGNDYDGNRIAPVAQASPYKFNSYLPLDLGGLAVETLSTLRAAKQRAPDMNRLLDSI